jgi:hypothetical protein
MKFFWLLICMLWSPFELTYIFFNKDKDISKIGLFLYDKFNSL